MTKRLFSILLTIALLCSVVDINTIHIFAQNNSATPPTIPSNSYDKSDFIIHGTVLHGFTEAGLQKHNALPNGNRNLIIPQDWGVTEIAAGAFITHDRSNATNSDLPLYATFNDYFISNDINLFDTFLENRNNNYTYTPSISYSAVRNTNSMKFEQSSSSWSSDRTNLYLHINNELDVDNAELFTQYKVLQKPFEYVSIPNTVTKIGTAAFIYGNFRNYNTYSTVFNIDSGTNLEISNFAFTNLSDNKNNIYILNGNNVKNIGLFSFFSKLNASTIKTADFSANTILSQIDDGAFLCTNLNNFKLPQNSSTFKKIGTAAFAGTIKENVYNNTTEFNLTSPITEIHGAAFYGSNVPIVNINNALSTSTLTEIKLNTFNKANIHNITTDLIISSSIYKINKNAFYNASMYNSIQFNEGVISINDNAFNTILKQDNIRKNVVFPNSLTKIGNNAFYNYYGFNNVTIGHNVAAIGDSAFKGSYVQYLNNTKPNEGSPVVNGTLTLNTKLKSIPFSCFANNNITNNPLDLPSLSVKEIKNNAFANSIYLDDNVNTFTIPTCVEIIHEDAFTNSNLKHLIFKDISNTDKSKLHTIKGNAFNNTHLVQAELRLPSSLKLFTDVSSAYNATEGTFANVNIDKVIFTNSINSIANGTFANTNIKEIFFENDSTVKHIGQYVFYNTPVLTKVDLGNSANVVLDALSFSKTPSLNNFDFTKISTIGNSAFSESGLSDIDITNNVKNIEAYAFSNTNINSIKYNPNINIIPSNLFRNSAISSITLGSHVNIIDETAFSNATIPNIEFLNNNTLIKPNAFNNATIRTLNITPNHTYSSNSFENVISDIVNCSITEIPSMLLYNATISKLNLTNTITINESAFEKLTTSSTLTLPSTIEVIKQNAFKQASTLNVVNIDTPIREVHDAAFIGAKIHTVNFNKMPQLFGQNVFAGSTSTSEGYKGLLENIIFSDNITEIPAGILQRRNDRHAINVTFGKNITKINDNAFLDARLNGTSKKGMFVYDNFPKLVEIGNNAFKNTLFDANRQIINDTNTYILSLPSTLRIIGENAFYNRDNYNNWYFERYHSINIPNQIERIGINAFANHKITDFSTIPDIIKQNTTNFRNMFGANHPETLQKYNITYRGTIFPLNLKDMNGNVPMNVLLNEKIRPRGDGYYEAISSGNNIAVLTDLGGWNINISLNKFNPQWKSSLKVIRGVNDNPITWINNMPSDCRLSVLDGLDLNTPGAQVVKVRADFDDKSYSVYNVNVNVAQSMADAWVPDIVTLTTHKGVSVDITTAVKNKPSNATLVGSTNIDFNKIGLQQIKLTYDFPDRTVKEVVVNLNILSNNADKWIPQITAGVTIKHDKNNTTQFDLLSLIKNIPEDGVTTTIMTPVFYNMNAGNYVGVVRVTFNEDNSYKDIKLQVAVQDDKNTYVVRLKKLVVVKGNVANLLDAIVEIPQGTGFEILGNDAIDTSVVGLTSGKIRATFPDLTTKDYTVEVEIIDPNTEAAQFKPNTITLTAYVRDIVDLKTGLKNAPTTANVVVKRNVNTAEPGRHVGVITVQFSDNSELDVDINVDVFNRDFFEIYDDSEIPSNYSKITFSEGDGIKFEDSTIRSKKYAAKNGIPIAFKFFPNTILQDGYYGNTIWTPLVNTVIESNTNFVASANVDTRTAAEKFVPSTKVLLLYKNDYTTSLTECLINKPNNMANLNVKVEAQRNSIGTHDGLLELVFDDTSKLDIPVKVQIVGPVNSEADRFIPNTQELTVYIGKNIDIKTGLLNPTSEYNSVRIKKDITTTQLGRVTGVLELTFSDASTRDVDITVIVVEKQIIVPQPTDADNFNANTKELTVNVGENIDIRTGLLNDESEYNHITIKQDISTTIPGRVVGVVTVHFDDNSSCDVNINVFVKSNHTTPSPTLADAFIPNTTELETTVGSTDLDIKTGLLNEVSEYDSISVIKNISTILPGKVIGIIRVTFIDASYKDIEILVNVVDNNNNNANSLAQQYSLTTQILEVKAGEGVDIKAAITSSLDDVVRIIVLQDVDTTFAGQKAGRLLLKFSDNSTLETAVVVKVTGSTNLNINNDNNNNAGGNTNNTTNNNNLNELKEYIKQLQQHILNNSTNNSTTIIQAPTEQDKLGKPIIKGEIEVSGYLDMTKDGKFKPDAKITRADFVVMFANAKELSGTKVVKFSDVKNGTSYFKALQACVSNNIINGYKDNTFRPNNPITRAEFAKMISILDGLNIDSASINAFNDVVPNHWARAYINSAFINGYLDGYPDSTFRPNAFITRAEAVKVLNRYTDKLVLDNNIVNSIDLVRYKDVPTNHWAYAEITSALNNIKLQKFIYSKDTNKTIHFRIKPSH